MTNYETVIRHKEGSLINVLVSASLLEIDNAEHVLIICRDITDRKLVEAAVAHANRQLNYVLDAASEIAIISTDVKGIVQMFNRGAEKMLGYRAREQIGIAMPFEIHDSTELAQRSQELSAHYGREVKATEVLTITPAKLGSETRNWTYICKNGQRLSVSLTVTRVQDGAGKIVGFLGIARDITLQLQAEKALQELNYQLEKRVEERTAELEDTNNNLASTMHNLQLAQAELVRSEKLTALGDIVAVVAHEINTPIGNCLTVATTLRDRSEELFGEVEQGTIRRSSLSRYMNDSKTGMDILIRGLHRSSELISNFKQVAVDQTSEQRRVFKLDKVVNEVVALMLPMLRKTPYKLTILIPEEITMDSFPGPIEQIVTNLINNSILHAFDEDQPGKMTLTAERQEHQVKIEFADDGRGIPEHYLNRIFDPFFTTKLGRGGTGLGLNIVHNIVKKMLGGQIEVNSTAGSGTSFVIVLPLVAPTNPIDRR
jgi:PAS domain S-box-containing protein